MIYIWLSALLFGLVHPGSKVILSTGLPLELFCIAYIGIRLIVQLPFVVKTKAYRLPNINQFKTVIILGLIGAGLQLAEFSGISEGQHVSSVTFLVYTHPVWSLLISRIWGKEKLDAFSLLKFSFALLGILLVLKNELNSLNIMAMWPSLLAGLLIALWIKLSNVARKEGFSTLKINFFYDLFALIALLVLVQVRHENHGAMTLVDFFKNNTNSIQMFLYSVLMGLLPNLLFYKGSEYVDALTAGYILLLEPVIASIVSFFLWETEITFTFITGAMLILSANIPQQVFRKRLRISTATLTLAILSSFSLYASEPQKEIILLEIIPTDNTEYTVSDEKIQIATAASMALAEYTHKTSCDLKLTKILETGNDNYLTQRINEIKKNTSNKVIVGLSRSNFARTAAKSSSGSQLKAISIGASASNIGLINPNFISIVNPWEKQFELIVRELRNNKCDVNETMGVFDPGDFISSNFMNAFIKQKLGKHVFNSKEKPIETKGRCIFIALRFSDATTLLSSYINKKWKGVFLGIGDWNIHDLELKKMSKSLSKNISLFVPTGWMNGINGSSKRFSLNFKTLTGKDPGPLAAYTFDGIIMAADQLCRGISPFENLDYKGNPDLLRKYYGKSAAGNLLSEMYMRTLKGGTQ